jgi:hypothetical protein
LDFRLDPVRAWTRAHDFVCCVAVAIRRPRSSVAGAAIFGLPRVMVVHPASSWPKLFCAGDDSEVVGRRYRVRVDFDENARSV